MGLKENIISEKRENSRFFLFIFLSSLPLNFLLPWWVSALVAFVIAFWQASSAKQAFLMGAAAIGLLWTVVASFWHFASHGILSDKVAGIFQLPNGLLLTVVVGLLAAIIGGSAALTGYWVREVFGK
ncbi:MAG: hypothetical protein V4683_10635 [Bacteroidota bacterium]